MQRFCPIVLLCLSILAAPTPADTLVINGQKIENARITALQRGMLQFTSPGRSGMIPLSRVDRIELDDEPLFNQAEAKVVQGKLREAYVLYARAERKFKRGLRRELALARINQIRRRIEGPLPKIPEPDSDGEGEGKTSEPDGKEVRDNAGPLSSPQALRKALLTAPGDPRKEPGWEKTEPLERNRKLHRYRTEHAKWEAEHDYRNKTVSWIATIIQADPGKGETDMVLAQAQPGYWIKAHVPDGIQDQRIVKGTPRVRITGRLASWYLDPARVNIQEGKFVAVLGSAKLQVVAEAKTGPARQDKPGGKVNWAVALIVDFSGSMGEAADEARSQMLQSAGKMKPDSSTMGVALFHGRAVGFPQAQLLPATRQTRTGLAKALENLKPRGAADFAAGFETAALPILQAKAENKAVYLFTDDPPELSDAVRAQLQKLTEGNVWIMFILVKDTPDATLKSFQEDLAKYKARVEIRRGT